MSGAGTSIRFGRSKAGHDKGNCYVIVREEPEYFYLADGVSRTVAAPKKKNRRHVQIIENIPDDVLAVFRSGQIPSDLEIKRALKLYNPTDQQEEM